MQSSTFGMGYFQQKSLSLGKRDRTRNLLIDSTINCFERMGPDRISIREIATSVGLSNGTFYNYFNDLPEALNAATYAVIYEVAVNLAERVEGVEDGLQKIVQSTLFFIDEMMQRPEWTKMVLHSWSVLLPPALDVAAGFRQDAELARRQGRLKAPITDFMARQFMTTLAFGCKIWIDQEPTEEEVRQIIVTTLMILDLPRRQAEKEVDIGFRAVADELRLFSRD